MKEQDVKQEVQIPEQEPRNILIVVDMQYDFIDGKLANTAAQEIVSPICDEIKNGGYTGVILTRDTHQYNYLSTPEGIKLPIEHCIAGTKGWCVHDDIIEACRKTVPFDYINKPTFGFKDWNKLNFTEKDTLTLVGTCTDICVVSNALLLKAMFPNTEIKVIGNLCAGLTPMLHEAALATMASCQIDVVYTEPIEPEEAVDVK